MNDPILTSTALRKRWRALLTRQYEAEFTRCLRDSGPGWVQVHNLEQLAHTGSQLLVVDGIHARKKSRID